MRRKELEQVAGERALTSEQARIILYDFKKIIGDERSSMDYLARIGVAIPDKEPDGTARKKGTAFGNRDLTYYPNGIVWYGGHDGENNRDLGHPADYITVRDDPDKLRHFITSTLDRGFIRGRDMDVELRLKKIRRSTGHTLSIEDLADEIYTDTSDYINWLHNSEHEPFKESLAEHIIGLTGETLADERLPKPDRACGLLDIISRNIMSGEEYAGIYPLIKEKTLGGFLENAPAQRCGSLNRELYPRLVSVLRCSQHNGLLHDEDLRGFWLDNIRYSTNDSILLDSIEALTDPDGARGYGLDIYGRIVRKEKSEQRENQFPFAIDVLAGRSDAGTDRIKSFIRVAGLPYSRDKEKRKG